MSAVAEGIAARPSRGVGPLGRLMASLRPIRRLVGRRRRRLLLGGVLMNLGVAVATLGAALTGAYLVGRALTGATSSDLVPLVWLVVALVIPIAVFGWLEEVLIHVLSFRMLDDLRRELFDRFRELAPTIISCSGDEPVDEGLEVGQQFGSDEVVMALGRLRVDVDRGSEDARTEASAAAPEHRRGRRIAGGHVARRVAEAGVAHEPESTVRLRATPVGCCRGRHRTG